MRMRLLCRLSAGLLVLAFVVGLPMQGRAMTWQASPASTSGFPAPDGCDNCGGEAAASNCPVVFCVGLTAIVPEPLAIAPADPATAAGNRSDAGAGLGRDPDPRPPPTAFLS